jgi:hypothetical protein
MEQSKTTYVCHGFRRLADGTTIPRTYLCTYTPKTKPLDASIMSEILARYADGVSMKRLGQDYKLSEFKIRKICKPTSEVIPYAQGVVRVAEAVAKAPSEGK